MFVYFERERFRKHTDAWDGNKAETVHAFSIIVGRRTNTTCEPVIKLTKSPIDTHGTIRDYSSLSPNPYVGWQTW